MAIIHIQDYDLKTSLINLINGKGLLAYPNPWFNIPYDESARAYISLSKDAKKYGAHSTFKAAGSVASQFTMPEWLSRKPNTSFDRLAISLASEQTKIQTFTNNPSLETYYKAPHELGYGLLRFWTGMRDTPVFNMAVLNQQMNFTVLVCFIAHHLGANLSTCKTNDDIFTELYSKLENVSTRKILSALHANWVTGDTFKDAKNLKVGISYLAQFLSDISDNHKLSNMTGFSEFADITTSNSMILHGKFNIKQTADKREDGKVNVSASGEAKIWIQDPRCQSKAKQAIRFGYCKQRQLTADCKMNKQGTWTTVSSNDAELICLTPSMSSHTIAAYIVMQPSINWTKYSLGTPNVTWNIQRLEWAEQDDIPQTAGDMYEDSDDEFAPKPNAGTLLEDSEDTTFIGGQQNFDINE